MTLLAVEASSEAAEEAIEADTVTAVTGVAEEEGGVNGEILAMDVEIKRTVANPMG